MTKRHASELRCHCGGNLRTAALVKFDFSGYAGLPVTVDGGSGYRCSQCSGQTIDGASVDRILTVLARKIVGRPDTRLNPAEAKFLRRRLGITQEQLAQRMNVERETVARWESGAKDISPQHDYMLRALVVTNAPSATRGSHSPVTERTVLSEERAFLSASLAMARTAPPPAELSVHQLVFDKILRELRPPRSPLR